MINCSQAKQLAIHRSWNMANIAALSVLLQALKLTSVAKLWSNCVQRYVQEAQLLPGKHLAQFDLSDIKGICNPPILNSSYS
jgi:hypothetical protein